MRRRTLLGFGLATGALLATVGTVASLHQPAWRDGALLAGGRRVLQAVALAVLDGSLPADSGPRDVAVVQHLTRMERTLQALPPHVQSEVARLLAVLDSAPGRRWLAGVQPEWPSASLHEIQAGLAEMRVSSVLLRRQAYAALRDLTNAAWFSDPSTWGALGYLGPEVTP